MALALGTADSEEPPLSFTIPAARLGDRADYVYTEETSTGVDESGLRSVTFAESVRIEDKSGTPRDAIRIDVQDSNGSLTQHFVDIESRFLLRTAFVTAGPARMFMERSFEPAKTDEVEHTAASVFQSELFATEIVWQAVVLQGQTWHVGQDLSSTLRHMLKAPPEDEGIRMWIGEPSRFEGKWVWPIRSSILENGQRNHFLTSTLWYAESQPMPVHYEGPAPYQPPYGAVDGGHRAIETLDSFSSGATHIPWGPHLAAWNAPELVGDVLPTPFPSGGGDRMGWGIDDAVAEIEADPTLVRFADWKKTSPDHRVVYFYYESGLFTHEESPRRYGVGFASQKTNTIFMVSATSAPLGAREPSLTTELPLWTETGADGRGSGPLTIPDSSRGWENLMPQRFVTLDAVDEIWKVHAHPETYAEGPEWVAWGTNLSLPSDPLGIRHAFRTVDYGAFDNGPPLPYRSDRVMVDVVTGRLLLLTTSQIEPVQLGVTSALKPAAVENLAASPAPKRFAPTAIEIGAASLLFLIASVSPWLKTWFVGLYSKLTKNDVLDHKLREHILELVKANPGISPVAIQKELGVGEGTVQHHLRVLHRNKILTSIRDGRHRRVFLVGQSDASRFKEIAILRNPVTRQTWDIIGTEPGITRETLAARLGITTKGVSWHLRRLQAVALVRRQDERRTFLYFRTEAQGALHLTSPVAA